MRNIGHVYLRVRTMFVVERLRCERERKRDCMRVGCEAVFPSTVCSSPLFLLPVDEMRYAIGNMEEYCHI